MRRFLVPLFVLLLVVAACGDDADTSGDADAGGSPEVAVGPPQPGGEITYGLANDGTGFDTTSAITPGANRIVTALSDTLVSMAPGGEWQPDLAESLTPNADATAWTIKLRDGVTFHDGASLDAAAVKANMDAYKASPTVGFAFGRVSSIDVVDPLTVQVNMGLPWAAFPYILTGQPGWMVSPETIGSNDTMVSTGAFMLESWNPGDSARVVRNPNYWRADEGLPYLDAITFKVIPEQSTRVQALETGDIQAYAEPGSVNLADLEASDDVDVYRSEGGGNEALVILNTDVAPVDDVRVRTGLAMAVDRQLIIDNFRDGLTEPADSFFSPDNRFWVENGYPDFDLDGAAELIAEYEDEVGDVAITLTHSNLSPADQIAEVIASFWEDAGVDVTLDPIGPEAAVDRVLDDDFEAITWIQFGAPDPDVEYVFFHSSMGALNWSNLIDEEIDAAFDAGREALDDDARAEAYADLQLRLVEQMPFVWIDHVESVEAVAHDPSLQGFADATFPGGDERLPMVNGMQQSYSQLWLVSG
jgi:peptide/nickel transport system substrate-binding protein